MPRLGDSSLGKSVNIKASALPFTQVSVQDLEDASSSVNQTRLSGKRQGAGFFSSEYSLCVATGPLSTDPWICSGGLEITPIEASSSSTESSTDFSTAQVGDYTGGGVYGGTHTDGTKSWHLIFATQAGEIQGLVWADDISETGSNNMDDGQANQTLVLDNFLAFNPEAFLHCRDYVDGDGNNDYYLPALNELKKAQPLLDMEHPEFQTSIIGIQAFRWTSTEDAAPYEYAYTRTFDYDGGGVTPKTSTSRWTRPVRRVLL